MEESRYTYYSSGRVESRAWLYKLLVVYTACCCLESLSGLELKTIDSVYFLFFSHFSFYFYFFLFWDLGLGFSMMSQLSHDHMTHREIKTLYISRYIVLRTLLSYLI